MGAMSKEKGKRGEREAAAALVAALGCEARRGVQYQGGDDSPDVLTSIPGIHWEVKRTERLNLYDAVEQAETDAGDQIPVVLHRRNRGKWLVVVPLEWLAKLAEVITWEVMDADRR